MCGICGFLNLNGEPAEPAIGISMVEMLEHRGPDFSDIFVQKFMCLGATRLSIIDPSSAGKMPMVDHDTGVAVSFNGEIYNFNALRHLTEYDYKSSTDTEVILALYLTKGKSFLGLLRGIFAISIWDPRTETLLLARDQMGVKPLYFGLVNSAFVFASEIKSILKYGAERQPNYQILSDYLAHGVYDHTQHTFFKGINQLAAGELMLINREGIRSEKFWSLPSRVPRTIDITMDEAREKFLGLAESSLAQQLVADVPTAISVSGGLDSTFLMSGINSLNGGQGNVAAFSYFFDGSRFDESSHVKMLASDLGWKINFVKVEPSDVIDLSDEVMTHQEQPFPGIITIAKHKMIKEMHSNGIKVLLEGQGGDEIAAGYKYVVAGHILDLIREGEVVLAGEELKCFFGSSNALDNNPYKNFFDFLPSLWNTGYTANGLSFLQENNVSTRLHGYKKPLLVSQYDNFLLEKQYQDLFFTKLPRILRACDRSSMASSVELRVPYLDIDLVEFVFSLPGKLKIKNGQQRAFYRDALKKKIKLNAVDVPKRHVVDPQSDWLGGELSEWVGDILHSKRFKERGLFDMPQVLNAFKAFRNAENNPVSFHVWQWVCIDLWYRNYIECA